MDETNAEPHDGSFVFQGQDILVVHTLWKCPAYSWRRIEEMKNPRPHLHRITVRLCTCELNMIQELGMRIRAALLENLNRHIK